MTEAELWHMMLLSVDDLSTNLETVLTIVFAYLAAAHFVGKKLTRFQAALISFFFLFAAGISGFMSLVMWRRATYFMDQLGNRLGVETFAPNRPLIVIFAIMLALFIPACIFFMYQIRRHSELGLSTRDVRSGSVFPVDGLLSGAGSAGGLEGDAATALPASAIDRSGWSRMALGR